MIDPAKRDKVFGGSISPDPEGVLLDRHSSHTWTGLRFPDHIDQLVQEATRMDRAAHQLLNDFKLTNPPVPKLERPVREVVKGAEIQSARLTNMTSFAPSFTISVQCGVYNAMETRSTVEHTNGRNALRINALETEGPSEACLTEARTVATKGLTAVHAWMAKMSADPELNSEDGMYVRIFSRELTRAINEALRMTVRPSLKVDSFMADWPDLLKLLDNEGFVNAPRYFNKLLMLESLEMESQLPRAEGLLVPMCKTVVLYIGKTTNEMALNEIHTLPVLLSGVYHPTLLKTLTNLSQAYNVPKVLLVLPDDTFVCYAGIEATTSWTICRA